RVAWGRQGAGRSASSSPGTSPGSAENGQSGPRHSLISSLIHPGTRASIGVYHELLSSQRDLRGRSCTVIRNPEKRKVGDGFQVAAPAAKLADNHPGTQRQAWNIGPEDGRPCTVVDDLPKPTDQAAMPGAGTPSQDHRAIGVP